MYTLKVEHKYCGCVRVIEGESIAKAFKDTNTDPTVWEIIEISYED